MTNAADGRAEREIVERYFAAINRRDVAAIVADLADDCEWSWPGSGEVIRGRPAIETVVERTPSLPRVLVHRIIGGPDLVGRGLDRRLRRWRALAEHQPVRVPGGPDHGQDRQLRLGLRAPGLAARAGVSRAASAVSAGNQETGSSRPAARAAFALSAQAPRTLSLWGRIGQCSSRLPISSQ